MISAKATAIALLLCSWPSASWSFTGPLFHASTALRSAAVARRAVGEDGVETASQSDIQELMDLERRVMHEKGSTVPLELQKWKDEVEENVNIEDQQSSYIVDAALDEDPHDPISVINGERHFKNIICSDENYDTRPGQVDPAVLAQIQPVLDVLSGSVELLEAADGKVRLLYHGLIRNQIGMQAWASKMIADAYPELDKVVLCTTRTRDPWD